MSCSEYPAWCSKDGDDFRVIFRNDLTVLYTKRGHFGYTAPAIGQSRINALDIVGTLIDNEPLSNFWLSAVDSMLDLDDSLRSILDGYQFPGAGEDGLECSGEG